MINLNSHQQSFAHPIHTIPNYPSNRSSMGEPNCSSRAASNTSKSSTVLDNYFIQFINYLQQQAILDHKQKMKLEYLLTTNFKSEEIESPKANSFAWWSNGSNQASSSPNDTLVKFERKTIFALADILREMKEKEHFEFAQRQFTSWQEKEGNQMLQKLNKALQILNNKSIARVSKFFTKLQSLQPNTKPKPAFEPRHQRTSRPIPQIDLQDKSYSQNQISSIINRDDSNTRNSIERTIGLISTRLASPTKSYNFKKLQEVDHIPDSITKGLDEHSEIEDISGVDEFTNSVIQPVLSSKSQTKQGRDTKLGTGEPSFDIGRKFYEGNEFSSKQDLFGISRNSSSVTFDKEAMVVQRLYNQSLQKKKIFSHRNDAIKKARELKECTFVPITSARDTQEPSTDLDASISRLQMSKSSKTLFREKEIAWKQHYEQFNECTFKPAINQRNAENKENERLKQLQTKYLRSSDISPQTEMVLKQNNQVLNSAPDLSKPQTPNQQSPKRYEYLYADAKRREDNNLKQQIYKNEKIDVQGCSFKPSISPGTQKMYQQSSQDNLGYSRNQIQGAGSLNKRISDRLYQDAIDKDKRRQSATAKEHNKHYELASKVHGASKENENKSDRVKAGAAGDRLYQYHLDKINQLKQLHYEIKEGLQTQSAKTLPTKGEIQGKGRQSFSPSNQLTVHLNQKSRSRQSLGTGNQAALTSNTALRSQNSQKGTKTNRRHTDVFATGHQAFGGTVQSMRKKKKGNPGDYNFNYFEDLVQ